MKRIEKSAILVYNNDTVKRNATVVENRIGIARGQNLYDDYYDFDEMNPEIAKMFGVLE